jgi:hypothetical protein
LKWINTRHLVRRMRWAGHVARRGERRNAYRILVEKPEEKRPLGRPRRRWVNNIKMDLSLRAKAVEFSFFFFKTWESGQRTT